MTLLENYIHAVKQELPAAQREDIGRELQANILDQLDAIREQTGRDASRDEVIGILEKLGHPARVAAAYVPATPLVSAELMPIYRQVLAYGLGIALLLQSLKSASVFMQAGHYKISQAVMQLLAGFAGQAMLVFTSLTVLFYLGARTGLLYGRASQQAWRVSDLPERQYTWQAIPASEVITDLAIYGFALLLIWHKLWMPEQSLQELRVDFSPALASYLPWMAVLLCASVLFSVSCLLRPNWNRLRLGLNFLQTLVYALLFLIFSQLDALVLNTGVSAILDLQRLDRSIRLACFGYALYLLFLCVRDGRRFLLLQHASADGKVSG